MAPVNLADSTVATEVQGAFKPKTIVQPAVVVNRATSAARPEVHLGVELHPLALGNFRRQGIHHEHVASKGVCRST